MNRHLTAGVAAGIVAPSALVFIINAWQVLTGGSDDGRAEWSLTRRVDASLMPLPYAMLALFLYGLPMFLILRRLRLANVYACVITALVPVGIAGAMGASSQKLGLFGALCLVSGLSFWVFARKSVVNERPA